MSVYTFKIKKKDDTLALVGVDVENKDIGFSWYSDNELNEILNILVDVPQLIIMTGDSVGSSYVVMKEIIGLDDERFYDALKSQLIEYDFSERSYYDNKSLQDILN